MADRPSSDFQYFIQLDSDGNFVNAGQVSGSVTITGDALTALEASADSGTLTAAALGTPADAAWSGTGDGTVISLLKAIALNTTPP